jgi:hypothetical protein
MEIDEQRYYWLFSSSSQTIASLVAFLVTGFALVLNIMESFQQTDETLTEIHNQIKTSHYKKLYILSVISGLAIISSLLMIYVNGSRYSYKQVLFAITSVLNVMAIGLAILFIISIINPDKYKIAAEEILREEKNEFPESGNEVDKTYFMSEFLELEKNIKRLLNRPDEHKTDLSQNPHSFRQLVTDLFDKGSISKEELYELLRINKYRNLIFHGHLEKVDKSLVDKVKKINATIAKL